MRSELSTSQKLRDLKEQRRRLNLEILKTSRLAEIRAKLDEIEDDENAEIPRRFVFECLDEGLAGIDSAPKPVPVRLNDFRPAVISALDDVFATASALAVKMGCDKTTASSRLRTMESEGLVMLGQSGWQSVESVRRSFKSHGVDGGESIAARALEMTRDNRGINVAREAILEALYTGRTTLREIIAASEPIKWADMDEACAQLVKEGKITRLGGEVGDERSDLLELVAEKVA